MNIFDPLVSGSLSVSGSAQISGSLTVLGNISGITSNALTSSYVEYNNVANKPSLISGSGTTNYLAKFTAGGTVGDSAIFESGGNVGIGTSSPALPLEVVGAIPARFTASSAVASPAYGGVIVARTAKAVNDGTGIVFNLNNSADVQSEYAYIGALIETNTSGGQNGAILFSPSAGDARTERMRITSGGNVLIGTTTDNGIKLRVNGTTESTIFTGAFQSHGVKVFIYGPSSSETINLPSQFPQIDLVIGNVWGVIGKCTFFGAGGTVEIREFYLGRNASGTWSSASYNNSSNTGAVLQSVVGSGNGITINMNSGSYLTLELSVMSR
jgi:hypothetical protein